MPGRQKFHGTHYYPALLKPQGNCVPGSDHPDIDVFQLPLGGSSDYAYNLNCLVSTPSQRQWDMHKTETGITKPPLILGLNPLQSLRDWAVFRDEDAWTAHGQAVENTGTYIPSSFDRKPCNIADKINTDYKTWEFHLYIFGLAPTLLYDVLPEHYWANFCKLVCGIQIMSQYVINKQDLEHAYVLLCSWGREFELIYYQLRQDRLHFIRPCVHQVLHLVTETMHKGPPICYAQWVMERTIGNLGQEIWQPSKPYKNLAEEGVRRCRVNALLAIMPKLDDGIKGDPMGSINLGDGYILLRKRDKRPWLPTGEEARIVSEFIGRPPDQFKRWVRLCLPNGQIARSLWREKLKPSTQVHFIYGDRERFGEVQYFARLAMDATKFEDVAIVRLYSLPDEVLLQKSSHTLASSKLLNELVIVRIKSIKSVVAMIPHRLKQPSGIVEDRFFLMEKLGLDVSQVGVPYSVYQDDEDDQGADIE
ncbi:hypothetical protein M404DRAFT_32804 [Pisolithus tinctorius Marx 270]|uniref:Uncharacterized protein n=1 Tax=Pisolithus tinctorius Marx 270 TaxID=870435 RepID=A0A0C3NMW8_PISTI|nr:hypothetical protein M404DRAFT_32804 [Pisolithus tinctorius Marx 270]